MTATVQDLWVSVGELRFHYRDWGSSGEPLVLVHGLASTCHIWDLVAPILSRRYAVLALDQRGHGETDKPDVGYDFATVAADLHRFVEALGVERPLVVGHSWGGNVALEYAATHPSEPRGLCLIDGGTIEISDVPGMTHERARKEMAPPDFTGLSYEQLSEMARSRDWGFPFTPEIEEMMSTLFQVMDDRTVRSRFSRENHMAVIDAFWEHRPSALYARIGCPVLLMPTTRSGNGSSEDLHSGVNEALTLAGQLIPVSKTVWLEDSVHDVPLQRPELVAEVIDKHVHDGFFG